MCLKTRSSVECLHGCVPVVTCPWQRDSSQLWPLACPAIAVWSCAGASRVLVSQRLGLLPGAPGEKGCLLLGHGMAGQSGLCWLFSRSSQGFPQVSIHWRSCLLIRLTVSPVQMDIFKLWKTFCTHSYGWCFSLSLLSCVLLPRWVCVTCSDSWLARCRQHMPTLVVE